jgi:hypothetical protein
MNLTDKQKLDIILEALHIIGSYEKCDCGCPHNRKARIAGKPVHTWYIANEALKAVGEEIKTYEENCVN